MAARAALAWCLGTVVVLTWAAPAPAATTCFYDIVTDNLIVTMSAGGDQVHLQRSGTDIQVLNASFALVNCGGASDPTVANTDRVFVTDTSAGSTAARVFDPVAFIDGSNEIEFDVDLGPGKGDSLMLAGGSGGNVWRYGSLGININVLAGADADYTFTGVERHSAQASSGGATILGVGSQGTGAPFPGPLELSGSFGDDILYGGAGPDLFHASFHADTFSGQEGRDTLDYCCVLGSDGVLPVRVTVGVGADDGAGDSDESITSPGTFDFVLDDVEVILGTLADDTLIGHGGRNVLDGGIGRDRLLGRGGRDRLRARDFVKDRKLNCGPGKDRIRFDAFDPRPISC